MTIAEGENTYINRLKGLYDREEAKSLYYFALEHVCQLTKGQALLRKSTDLPQKDELSLTIILDELESGKPIQYVTGETVFYGLKIKVNPSVLIPRPETEELVHWILQETNQNFEVAAKVNVLDIGTGSGCIPIALKMHMPQSDVAAMDISSSALETAMTNAVFHRAEIRFIQDDILQPKLEYKAGTFDIIVSNPPYITDTEQADMHPNVLKFEPHNALFVPDSDALIFYVAIVRFAQVYLKEGGWLFFEINEQFGNEVVELLVRNGFKEVELRKDLMGKDRMVRGRG